jgi:hypothetical protein
MAYDYVMTAPPGGLQDQILIDFPGSINFTQIFDGLPQFFPGSIITVQEIVQFLITVTAGEEHLVDVDYRWYEPKVYLGSYQLQGGVGVYREPETEGGQGFLVNSFTEIKRYSTYTIVASPSVPVGTIQGFTVDNCNLALRTVGFGFGGVSIDIQTPLTNDSLLKGEISIQRARLNNTPYNQFFSQLGLYINPGCRLLQARHKIAVINTIAADLDPYSQPLCVPINP